MTGATCIFYKHAHTHLRVGLAGDTKMTLGTDLGKYLNNLNCAPPANHRRPHGTRYILLLLLLLLFSFNTFFFRFWVVAVCCWRMPARASGVLHGSVAAVLPGGAVHTSDFLFCSRTRWNCFTFCFFVSVGRLVGWLGFSYLLFFCPEK